jgi:hypothetical protein
MSDIHEYFDESGTKWNRVYTSPQVSTDVVNLNCFSEKDFLKKTSRKGTLGELWDRSKEFSQKRKDKEGIDTVAERFKKDYSKTRKGRKIQTED